MGNPANAQDAATIVAEAAGQGRTLEIIAGGSKRKLGRPPQAVDTLDVSRLSGVIDYDPAELVITAHAATPMADIEPLLAASQQMLAFEPPDWRGLLGTAGTPTLGGVVACNLAGPRRVRAGAARDHLLGFAAINGTGASWRSGGRVVKNVTGYDMSKLQAGAWGTLSVLTELSIRVLPRPETACTLVLHGLADAQAVAAMARALNTPHEVSAAAHLPGAAAARAGLQGPATLLRLEGPEPSVAYRTDAMRTLLGAMDRLDAGRTARLWTQLGDAALLPPGSDRIVWRICPTPSAAHAVVQAVADRLPGTEAVYDWGGGLVWLSLDAQAAGQDGGAAIVRGVTARAGGHAMLVVAPDDARASVAVFAPEPPGLAALTRRVKASFDPQAILNPGRMWQGL